MEEIKYLSKDGVLFLLKDLYPRFARKADVSHVHDNATAEAAGFMSVSDKAKLDGISEGATATEIATVINDASTDLTAASARAVYNYVKNALTGISSMSAQIVQQLPETGKTNIIYLVPKSASESNNTYDEYMWINNKWELIGTTGIDLSGYLRAEDLVALTNAEITTLITAAGG